MASGRVLHDKAKGLHANITGAERLVPVDSAVKWRLAVV